MLGAILLAGYLGGTVAVQVRAGNPLFSEARFPVYIGALVWGGLYLRERRLRNLLSLRSWTPYPICIVVNKHRCEYASS